MKKLTRETTKTKYLIITYTAIFICLFVVFRYYDNATTSKALLTSLGISLFGFTGVYLANKFLK